MRTHVHRLVPCSSRYTPLRKNEKPAWARLATRATAEGAPATGAVERDVHGLRRTARGDRPSGCNGGSWVVDVVVEPPPAEMFPDRRTLGGPPRRAGRHAEEQRHATDDDGTNDGQESEASAIHGHHESKSRGRRGDTLRMNGTLPCAGGGSPPVARALCGIELRIRSRRLSPVNQAARPATLGAFGRDADWGAGGASGHRGRRRAAPPPARPLDHPTLQSAATIFIAVAVQALPFLVSERC